MNDLFEINKKYGSDKGTHGYLNHYYEFFKDRRYENLKILEIGIFNGASLRLWKEFFPNSEIYGIDNQTKTDEGGAFCSDQTIKSLNESGIKTFIADQSKKEDLEEFIKASGVNFDIIIDDGSHKQKDQQVALGSLFPYLNSKGIYIIEDLTLPHYHCTPKDGKISWGVHKQDLTDITSHVLFGFIAEGKINSMYISEKDEEYLNTHIKRNIHGVPKITFVADGNSVFARLDKNG